MAGEKQVIYLVRHGETDYNRNGIVQGSGVDSSLNEVGQKQANAFFNLYQTIPFQHVYFSALIRTKETISPFLKQGLPHSIHSEINEISWGDHEGKKGTPEMGLQYKAMIQEWRSGNLDARLSNAESARDLLERLDQFLYQLRTDQMGNFLVCSHGRSIRALLCLMQGIPGTKMDQYKPHNTGLFVLERKHSERYYRMTLQNDIDHLNVLNVS